jgi:multidrug efflux pump subunit AcrB
MGVPLSEVFLTLQTYLGGYYTNDFNQFGRTWQVNLQADPAFRMKPEDIGQLKVRNSRQEIVPLASVVNLLPKGGPAMVTRYNGITAAAINGAGRPGVGSGDMIRAVEQSAAKTLPQGTDFQWTELTLLQIKAGNTAVIVFAVAVLLVYLLLAAQYESIALPWAVILVVPMCLLCAVAGVRTAGMDLTYLRTDRFRGVSRTWRAKMRSSLLNSPKKNAPRALARTTLWLKPAGFACGRSS